jgi:hypothetical protein
MNNTNAIFLTIGIAAVLAIAIAPSLNPDASAVKEEQEEECLGDPQEREDCPGESGGQNPNREQQECDVTAGSNDKRVEGQFKKECED